MNRKILILSCFSFLILIIIFYPRADRQLNKPHFTFDKRLWGRDQTTTWSATDIWIKKLRKQAQEYVLQADRNPDYLFQISEDYSAEDLLRISDKIASCGLQKWRFKLKNKQISFATIDSEYYQFYDTSQKEILFSFDRNEQGMVVFVNNQEFVWKVFEIDVVNFNREFQKIRNCAPNVVFGLCVHKSLPAEKYFELSDYIHKKTKRPPLLILQDG